MYTKVISLLPAAKTSAKKSIFPAFAGLANLIFKSKESLFIPGANHCMFGEKKNFFGNSIYKDRRLPINERLFAIGDIHGSLDKLIRLINILNPSSKDILVFLGDYIDRGDKSKEVIDFLMNLQTITNCVYLGGNHECMYLGGNKYPSLHPDEYWMVNGGYDTLLSYKCPINYKSIQKKDMTSKFKILPETTEALWRRMDLLHLANSTETVISSDFQFKLFLKVLTSYPDRYTMYLPDYIVDAPKETPFLTHGDFFGSLRDFAITQGKWTQHYNFSHAGFDPNDPTNVDKIIGMTTEREYMLKSKHVDPKNKYIFGHTPIVKANQELFPSPLINYLPFETPLYVNIDTKAYGEGPLTAIELRSGKNYSTY